VGVHLTFDHVRLIFGIEAGVEVSNPRECNESRSSELYPSDCNDEAESIDKVVRT
jgi:hypothetical protein